MSNFYRSSWAKRLIQKALAYASSVVLFGAARRGGYFDYRASVLGVYSTLAFHMLTDEKRAGDAPCRNVRTSKFGIFRFSVVVIDHNIVLGLARSNNDTRI